jgi:localization factor PodJL
VTQDFIGSYVWLNRAAANYPPSPERDRAASERDALLGAMTVEQIERAQTVARNWTPQLEQPVSRPEQQPRPSPLETEAGQAIAAVQETLRQLGYDPGPVDGIEGPKTRTAVCDFRKSRGLTQTGRITLDLIQELSAAFFERT